MQIYNLHEPETTLFSWKNIVHVRPQNRYNFNMNKKQKPNETDDHAFSSRFSF